MMKRGRPLLLGEGPGTKSGINNCPYAVGREKGGKRSLNM